MKQSIQYPLELSTERLLIRSPRNDDATRLNEAIVESFDVLKEWMPWADHLPSLSESKTNCADAVSKFKDGTDYRLHIFLKDSGLFLGGSGLHRFDWSIPKFEIGYWIRQSHSGKGYATEAVSEISRFALEDLGAKRVEIRTCSRNIKSCQVAERSGFSLEGILRNDSRHVDGSLRDTKVYSRIVDGKGV